MSIWSAHPHLALALLHQQDLRDQADAHRMARAARDSRRRRTRRGRHAAPAVIAEAPRELVDEPAREPAQV